MKTQNHRRPQISGQKSEETNSKKTLYAKRARDEMFQRIKQLAIERNYQKLLELTGGARHEPRVRNIRGVCLLRMGRIDEAIRLYRELVLKPGCTWTRSDVPVIYKTNFALALLLGGHASGCMDILDDIADERCPAVQQIQIAIADWEKELSFWKRLNWRIGRLEPSHSPVTLNFEPGKFDWEITLANEQNREDHYQTAA